MTVRLWLWCAVVCGMYLLAVRTWGVAASVLAAPPLTFVSAIVVALVVRDGRLPP